MGPGGDERDRTADPLLAKQVLSQLSYTPIYNPSITYLRIFFSFFAVRRFVPSKLNNVDVRDFGQSDLGSYTVQHC